MSILGAIGGLLGGLFSSRSQEKIAQQQMELQKQFAKNSVQWRVADAQKAGVGSLAALGMQPISYSPVSVGGTDWSSIGQNIGSSLQSVMSPQEKDDDYTNTMKTLNVQRATLENDIIANNAVASRMALVTQPALGPGVPSTEGPGSKTPDDIRMFGYDVKKSPSFSDAEVIQNRYGEPAEWLYFPFVAGADAWESAVDASAPMRQAMSRYYQQMKARHAAQYLIGQRRRSRTDHGYW